MEREVTIKEVLIFGIICVSAVLMVFVASSIEKKETGRTEVREIILECDTIYVDQFGHVVKFK